MYERPPRLWERPHTDLVGGGPERFDAPSDEPGDAEGIRLDADGGDFTVANTSAADRCVLLTLLARAAGEDAEAAQARLRALTSAGFAVDIHRVQPGEQDAYRRLWHDDVAVRTRSEGCIATRSGTVVVPLPAGTDVRLGADVAVSAEGVVVAAVAAVGVGLDGELRPVDGPSATLGERPPLPR